MLDLLPWAIVAVLGGFIAVKVGEGAEDFRRKLGKAADNLKEVGAPQSFIQILKEGEHGDKSGMVKAIYAFVKRILDDEDFEAGWKEFVRGLLDKALDDPEQRETIKKALVKVQKIQDLEDQEVYERVLAGKGRPDPVVVSPPG